MFKNIFLKESLIYIPKFFSYNEINSKQIIPYIDFIFFLFRTNSKKEGTEGTSGGNKKYNSINFFTKKVKNRFFVVLQITMMNNNTDYRPKYPVQTLEKALEIIKYFKNNITTEGISISELSEKLNMGKSSVHRILDTLYAYNYVERLNNGSSYKLGWELFDIGNTVPNQHSLSSSNYIPLLEKLCAKYCETVNLGILNNDAVVIIYKMEPNIRLKANVQIGGREPLYATSLGKHFLSEMTDDEIYNYYRVHKIEPYTKNTIITPGKMVKELQEIRQTGVAIDREEFCEGLTCVSMPVRDFTKKIVASISLSGPTQRLSFETINQIKVDLKETCNKLSHYMGFKPIQKNRS